jgi:hypothetical protein
MEKMLFELFVCMLLIGTCFVVIFDTASADQEGDYTYTVSNGNATITKYNGAGGAITIPSSLGGYPTVSIGYQAFHYCVTLTSVTIPNCITTIGYQSFYSCTSLTSVTIPNSVITIGDNAFYYCTALTNVIIGNNVTTIGYQAFYSCTSLNSLTIGNSVNTIGNSAFSYCSSLTSVTIPNSVTSIGYSTFSYCSSLNSVIIGNSVNSIDNTVFAYCSSLDTVTIGNSVASIGDSAFAYCSSLTSITIPSSVTTIDDNAFYYCTALTNVTIGSGVTIIGESVFHTCSLLSSITFLGLVAPITVKSNWIQGTPDELRGHAYATSNFPAPDNLWNGLKMGTVLYGSGVYENKPPIVDFTWKPSDPKTKQDIIFDASWSYDPDGSITLYEWDWNNDGVYEASSLTTLTAIRSWSQAGNYPVTLRVTDNSSVNSTKTLTVSIEAGTPGFELILVVCAMALVLIWKRKR